MSASAKKVEPTWPGSTPTGKTRTVEVTVSKTVEITIDESVIAQGTLPDDPIFSGKADADEVVGHLAFNLLTNGLRLSQIDGYANCPDESAVVKDAPWEIDVGRTIATSQPASRRPAPKRTRKR